MIRAVLCGWFIIHYDPCRDCLRDALCCLTIASHKRQAGGSCFQRIPGSGSHCDSVKSSSQSPPTIQVKKSDKHIEQVKSTAFQPFPSIHITIQTPSSNLCYAKALEVE